MYSEKVNAVDTNGASLIANTGMDEKIQINGSYNVECIGEDGEIKWTDTIKNLVVTVGKNDLLDKYFAGSAYTAAWYMGLVDGASTPTYAAADTLASHAGWTEVTPYSNATRPTCTFATATTANPSVATNSASPASFTINATKTVDGAFLVSNNTKGGTTGTLFSASDFTGGDRSVISGDSLTVTYTFSLDAV